MLNRPPVMVVYVVSDDRKAPQKKEKKRKERKENLGTRLGCLAKGLKGACVGLPTLYPLSFLQLLCNAYISPLSYLSL